MRTDELLPMLRNVKKSAGGWVACCPAHEDHRQSLGISTGTDDRILVKCYAGCTTEDIVAKLGLTMADLMPETKGRSERTIVDTYDYTDENGNLVYQVVRFHPKDFRQRRPDGKGGWKWSLGDTRRVLYHLVELKVGIAAGRRVFVVEGEKDVHTLESLGFVATTNAGGAGKWTDDYTAALSGAHVVILPDNDDPGRHHAETVAAALAGKAASVKIIRLPGLPEKGDVTDWVRQGGTADELKRMVTNSGDTVPGVTDLKTIIGRLSRYKTEPMPPGVDYPWATLNRRTRGMRPGWFIIWAGFPGSGKTAAVLQICFAAGKRGQRVLFNSLEMDEEELGIRVIQYWGLDTDHLFNNRMVEEDLNAFDLAYNLPGYENVSVCKEWTISALAARVAETKPDLVVVDYIGLMEPSSNDSDYQRTTKVSRGLTALAEAYKVPLLGVSHLARPSKEGKPHIPTMHDLRASGQLEGDADHIVIVYRDESGDDEEGRCQSSEGRFIIAKNRHAAASKPVPFTFDGERMTFKEIDRGQELAARHGLSVYQGGGDL